MHPQSKPEAQAAVAPSAPRIGPVPESLARPRVISWFAASFLHVAVAALLALQF